MGFVEDFPEEKKSSLRNLIIKFLLEFLNEFTKQFLEEIRFFWNFWRKTPGVSFEKFSGGNHKGVSEEIPGGFSVRMSKECPEQFLGDLAEELWRNPRCNFSSISEGISE